ncbi:MAG TPA: sulfate ABC transporter permease subunit CysT [Pirellulales bacterium]
MSDVNRRVLPGFRLGLTVTLAYITLLVLIPLVAVVLRASTLGWEGFLAAAWTPQAKAAYLVTFGTSFAAAAVSAALGLLIAWVLVRYEFFGKRILDAMVDLPFALPTAVAGLVYSSLYVKTGWLGQYLVPLGIEGANSKFAIVLVLTFIGFPFVVRSIQPVLETIDVELEEAASCLGATRWQTFRYVILPTLTPALVTGFALSFARGLGEYGSVVFVASNKPFDTQIAPMLVVSFLENSHYEEAAAVATVLLAGSLAMLLVINILERWSSRHA